MMTLPFLPLDTIACPNCGYPMHHRRSLIHPLLGEFSEEDLHREILEDHRCGSCKIQLKRNPYIGKEEWRIPEEVTISDEKLTEIRIIRTTDEFTRC